MKYDEELYNRRKHIDLNILGEVDVGEHFHQDIELLYMLSGTMDLQVGQQSSHMGPEDICVINANKRHGFRTSQDGLLIQLSITYELISDVFTEEPLFFLCDSHRNSGEPYDRLRLAMRRLLNRYMQTQGRRADFAYIALGYELLDILTSDFMLTQPEKYHLEVYDKLDERIDRINNYIRLRYNQPVSLKELSEKLYLSEGYLSRFFKKNYGMSFSDYLANVRLHHAMEDLLYTDMPITQIVYGNGFSNVTIFGKLFRETYGETPSGYRKKMKSGTPSEVDMKNSAAIQSRLADYLKHNHTEEAVQMVRRTASFRCCAAPEVFETRQSFGTINIGMAADLLKSEVQEHVILLNQTVGLTYVRFWNVFSPELLMDINNEASGFNFSRLDRILDFLCQQGIRPHMELGIKPRRVMKNLDVALNEDFGRESPYEQEGVCPEKWSRAVGALLHHLASRYGKALDTWRMELWFDESRWDMDTTAEYFELFNRTWEIARKYSTKLELGGCGLKFDYLESEISAFLKAWKQQAHHPDFISALYYAYERGTAIKSMSFRRSMDNEYLCHCLEKLKRLMSKAGMEHCRIYFTEWNLTVSDRNYINDTCFKGAYVVKNMLDIYGALDDIAYYQGSDCVTESYDSSKLLHGGTGLVSKDGILKPAGYAFRFLNQLYAHVAGRGENYIVTTDREDDYGILCHNQMNLSYNYYFIREDEVKKEAMDQYFTARETLDWQLTLEGVRNGLYRVKTFRINEDYGSLLDNWRRMDYDNDLSSDEIQYFHRISGPQITVEKIAVENGELTLSLVLNADEIAYVQIRCMP